MTLIPMIINSHHLNERKEPQIMRIERSLSRQVSFTEFAASKVYYSFDNLENTASPREQVGEKRYRDVLAFKKEEWNYFVSD